MNNTPRFGQLAGVLLSAASFLALAHLWQPALISSLWPAALLPLGLASAVLSIALLPPHD